MIRRTLTGLLSIGLGTLVMAVQPAIVAGHEPIDWVRRYAVDNKELFWKYGGDYPGWVTVAASDTLENDWSNAATNNSRVPSFESSASGAGRVYYSASMTSPCSGAAVWLACALGGGATDWEIHIRNLDGAPFGTWAWHDKAKSCAPGDVCFRLQRSLIHEPIHLTFGAAHSDQSQTNTVFTANQPSYANAGGSTNLLRRCDQAAVQLAYDLHDMAGAYGNCFDHIEHATTSGLKTDLTVADSSISACQGRAAMVSGRLQVHDFASYRELGGNPLESRRVEFDLGSTPSVTWATATDTAAPADNWSRSFSNASYGSRTYTAHFDREPDSALASSPQRSFTITWIPTKLC